MDVMIILIALWLYFIPTIVAVNRRSGSAGAAIVINVFLGWTLLGWVVALALAVSGTGRPTKSPMAKWGKF